MREPYELEMDKKGTLAAEFGKAVKRAQDDDRVTYITRDGDRVAAVVPLYVGVASDKEVQHDPVMANK